MSYNFVVRLPKDKAERVFELTQRRPDFMYEFAGDWVRFEMKFSSEELTLIKLVIADVKYDLPLEMNDD